MASNYGIFPPEIWSRIIRQLDNLKTKIRLERINRYIGNLIGKDISKSLVVLDISQELSADYSGAIINICDFSVRVIEVSNAIESLIKHGPLINRFSFEGPIDSDVVSRVYFAILRALQLNPLPVNKVYLSGAFASHTLVPTLLEPLSGSIRELILVDWAAHHAAHVTQFWEGIAKLRSLESFEIQASQDEWTQDDHLFYSLSGKPLKKLTLLSLQGLSGRGIAQAIRNFATPLTHLSLVSPDNGFLDEILWQEVHRKRNRMPHSLFQEIKYLKGDLLCPEVTRHIPDLCPELIHFFWTHSGSFQDYQVADFVAHFIDKHANNSNPRSLLIELEDLVIENWEYFAEKVIRATHWAQVEEIRSRLESSDPAHLSLPSPDCPNVMKFRTRNATVIVCSH